MAARQRHSAAGAEKTARIYFGAAGAIHPAARTALFYSGNAHKTHSVSEPDLKWYVKLTFKTALHPWSLARQGLSWSAPAKGFAPVLRYEYIARRAHGIRRDDVHRSVHRQRGWEFMKGTPQFPMCGFSGQVVQIFDNLGVAYKGLNLLENDELRQGIKTYSNWPTVPQLYVKGEFVGGCDIIREMFQAGELQSLFKDNGISVKEAA